MKNLLVGFSCAVAILALVVTAVLAGTISQSDMGTWVFQTNNSVDGVGQFVTGPGTPPLGNGSAELSTGTNGSTYSAIHNSVFDGKYITNLSSVAASYATYVPTTASVHSYPKLIIDLIITITTTTTTVTQRDELIFDPQSGQSQTATQGNWQTWDALNGIWHSDLCGTNGTLAQYKAGCIGDLVRQTGNPLSVSVRTRDDGTGGVRFQVGPNVPSDKLDGFVDNVTLGFDGNNINYDFEYIPLPTPTPTPLIVPIAKDECKGDGWKKFNSPFFKNQGGCVSFLEASPKAGKQQ